MFWKNTTVTYIILHRIVLIIMLFLVTQTGIVFGQNGPSYPRTGVMHFGRNAPAEWYANFDLVLVRTTRTSLVQDIKSRNPDAFVFGVLDWNFGAGIEGTNVPSEWRTYDSKGNSMNIYNANDRYTANFTDFCRTSPNHNNKKYNEFLPGYLVDRHDQNFFDGIATDGLWIRPRESEKLWDIDLDRNGVNDYDEHGKDWVREKWKAGVNKVVDEINRINNNRPIIINSGRFHTEREGYNWVDTNGMVLEHTKTVSDFNGFYNLYKDWMSKARQPHLLLFDGIINSKDDFSHMRYLLGITMAGDGYFACAERDLHHYYSLYDEFELDLGFPTGEMLEVNETGSNGQGVWVRFFTKGAVILNTSESPQTVSASQISAVNGYNGPYYRFQGYQAPNINNGQEFNQVMLDGHRDSKDRIIGDAILLTREPTTAVTDVIIDSDDEGTNPGSREAVYTGNWTQENDLTENAWAIAYKAHKDRWAMAYTTAGDGSNTAKFTPNIGLPGKYVVYEWHGKLNGFNQAKNAPYEVKYAGGSKSFSIDQSINQGQWNLLGEYQFNQGQSGYVKIANKADGVVVADAIKFVYAEGFKSDNVAPIAPGGVSVTPK